MAHPNARLTPRGRALLASRIRSGWTITAAARAAGVSRQTGSKWWARARSGELADRSSRVRHQPRQHPHEVVAALCQRRLETRHGPLPLAWATGMPASTVYAVLRRAGLARLDRLTPRPPVVRYERERPGELVHLDTKRLGRIGPGGGHRIHGRSEKDRHRGIGWNHVHVAVDDHSRIAYAEELGDESPATTVAFLDRAIGHFAAQGITVERVLTDNGTAYRSRLFIAACAERGIARRRTRPYRPQTNGKAERFIRTLLGEWAYARPFMTTGERQARLPVFLDFYNRARPHWSLAGQPPISRAPVNNLMGQNI
jgi:transposase InsO family protein